MSGGESQELVADAGKRGPTTCACCRGILEEGEAETCGACGGVCCQGCCPLGECQRCGGDTEDEDDDFWDVEEDDWDDDDDFDEDDDLDEDDEDFDDLEDDGDLDDSDEDFDDDDF